MSQIQTTSKYSFMIDCFKTALNYSENPNTKVGACIVNQDGVIIGKGYNRMPKGYEQNSSKKNYPATSWLSSKYAYVVFAEIDAIVKAKCSLEGCTMYTLIYPGNECAKMIVESGIKEVIYYSDKSVAKDYCIAAKIIFESAGTTVTEYQVEDKDKRKKLEALAKETIHINEGDPKERVYTLDLTTIDLR